MYDLKALLFAQIISHKDEIIELIKRKQEAKTIKNCMVLLRAFLCFPFQAARIPNPRFNEALNKQEQSCSPSLTPARRIPTTPGVSQVLTDQGMYSL